VDAADAVGARGAQVHVGADEVHRVAAVVDELVRRQDSGAAVVDRLDGGGQIAVGGDDPQRLCGTARRPDEANGAAAEVDVGHVVDTVPQVGAAAVVDAQPAANAEGDAAGV